MCRMILKIGTIKYKNADKWHGQEEGKIIA